VARVAGRAFTGAQDVSFAAIREAQLDRLADLIADHLDRDQVLGLLTGPGRAFPPLRLMLG
jgi:adenosylcobyric acid synthase